jgi:RNA polymerase sigma-70 factor (ECF subfamily)
VNEEASNPGAGGERGDSTERELVRRVRAGEVAAFDQLVRRYLRRAETLARRVMLNREDAEDLVQEAFLRALDRIETFDESRQFGPWFFRLLVNTGINMRRSRERRATEPEPFDAASYEPGPDEEMERTEIRERFAAALARLPERQREIIGMFEVDGFSSVEIAEILGVTPETVRWHVHQARRVLRQALASVKE